MDESKAVACSLDPNEASIHDARLIHGSPPNHSAIRRCGYTMRYMPTSVKFLPQARANHQIYLVRGRDKADNQYADPSKDYPSLARYRSQHARGGH